MNLNMVLHRHLILRLMELHLSQNKKIAAAKRGAVYDSRAARAAALLFSYVHAKEFLKSSDRRFLLLYYRVYRRAIP